MQFSGARLIPGFFCSQKQVRSFDSNIDQVYALKLASTLYCEESQMIFDLFLSEIWPAAATVVRNAHQRLRDRTGILTMFMEV